MMMPGSVIVRGETRIIGGRIHHDDKQITWSEADALAGRRLDRRKSWAFINGELCDAISWTQNCSGCAYDDGYHSIRGDGCQECGYHGVVRNSQWVPAIFNAAMPAPAQPADGE
jgi:hypothetical protein